MKTQIDTEWENYAIYCEQNNMDDSLTALEFWDRSELLNLRRIAIITIKSVCNEADAERSFKPYTNFPKCTIVDDVQTYEEYERNGIVE